MAGQQSGETLGVDLLVLQRRNPHRLHALPGPAEYVFAEEEQHPNLAIAPGQQPPLEFFLVRAVVGDEAREHQRGLRVVEESRGRHAFVERMQDERRQFPDHFAKGCRGRWHLPPASLIGGLATIFNVSGAERTISNANIAGRVARG